MTTETFGRALSLVLRHEGGYVDHPKDPGGVTNRGITLATLSAWRGRKVTKAEVKALTVEEAGAIYRANYWNVVKGDDLPAGLDYAVFDFAVNSGPARAAKHLQALGGADADGVIGPKTLAAVSGREPTDLIRKLTTSRLDFLSALPTWLTFGKGWRSRVLGVEMQALAMANGTPAPAPAPIPPPPDIEPPPVPVSQPASSGGFFYAALKNVFEALLKESLMPPIIGLLLQYAPDLVGIFAGDKAGTAAGKVADAAKVVFGTDDPKKAQAQIQMNPQLAQAFVEQAKVHLEEVRLAIADVQSARIHTLELAKQGSAISWGAPVVSVIVVIGFFSVMALLFVQPVDLPPSQAQLLNVLFGALIPAFGTVVQYWLGSSAGSKRSGHAVRAIAETVLPAKKGA